MAWVPARMTLLLVAALTGAGLVTGLLFAFSNVVLRALAALPPAEGMATMQRINAWILNPLFLGLFLGTPLLCLLLLLGAVTGWYAAMNWLVVAGALLYLEGPFGVTVLFNVPLNNRLADATPEQAASVWPAYRRNWQRWNHLRTAMGAAAIALLAAGLGAG